MERPSGETRLVNWPVTRRKSGEDRLQFPCGVRGSYIEVKKPLALSAHLMTIR